MGTIQQDRHSSSHHHLEDAVRKMLADTPTIWVFGYGSLLWKPDFQYKSKHIGYIKDYARRFYQGNVTFRGRPGQPGRVANLVESNGSQTWGVAYEVSGLENVTNTLQVLHKREVTLGGYVAMVTMFYPREAEDSQSPTHTNKHNVSDPMHNDSTNMLSESSVLLQNSYHMLHSEVQRMKSRLSDSIEGDSVRNIDGLEAQTESKPTLEDSNIDTSKKEVDANSKNISAGDSTSLADNHLVHVDAHHSESMLHIPHQAADQGENNSLQENSSSTKSLSESQRNVRVSTDLGPCPRPVPVLLYTACPDNDLYLGPDSITNMARQVVQARGTAGSDVEYITKIADFVRRYIPEDTDSHLFSLDDRVREEVYRQSISSSVQLGFSDCGLDKYSSNYEFKAESVMGS